MGLCEMKHKLNELVKDFQPDIIGIAEPRVSVSSRSVKKFCIDGFSRSIIHNSLDTVVGNLWVMWSSNIADPVVVNCSKQAITIGIDGVHISFVHASSVQTTRRNLWRQLDMGALQVPWQSGVHRIISRLDRGVINEFWLNRFENWRCKALPREVSDHSPLIGFPFVNTRPRRAPFRVQKMWFGHPDFMRMVEDSWKVPIVGSPAFIYPQKLKRLKQAQLRIESVMRLSDEDPSDVDKLNLMRTVAVEVNDIRMSSNTISELVDANGVTLTDCDQIRNLIVDYYEAKFNGDDSVPVETLFNIDHNSISLEESTRMDQLPSLEEIRASVFDLDADSAPGPDGLLMLLPKERGANTLRNFRPIGLSNFFSKIFTKILATRLGGVLDNLISEEQVAFMKRRNIHENISLASEMVNETQIKRKDGNVGFKLDITQDFDTVSWTFILEVFRRYGFSESWCDWILQILKSARISVLVNGSPEGFFSIDRGLRQGDPLSPLIFVLIEDVLSRNITKFFKEGKMTHMVNRKGIAPTHLFFADDSMIFCKGNMKSLRNLVDLLRNVAEHFEKRQNRCEDMELKYEGGHCTRRRE
ncbi:uncharacterized protein LOC113342274 [Papaver somniferum]|uniref:uncharacterized protein LOC113342274 n=1 Tax=Papaver somniferum TaxID=3469 RepID=UPI000E6F4C27|nr:uncharacterized protein LOC113342274 [Papaver somniferum]